MIQSKNSRCLKLFCTCLLTLVFINKSFAQTVYPDSLKKALLEAPEDTSKVKLLVAISFYYSYKYPDTVLKYAAEGLQLARKINYKRGEIFSLGWMGEAYSSKSNYAKAMEVKFAALRLAESLNDSWLVAYCKNFVGAIYVKTEDWKKSLLYYQETQSDSRYLAEYEKYIYGSIGICYLHLNNLDSAYYYISRSYNLDIKDKSHWTVPYNNLGNISFEKKEYEKALGYYRQGNALVTDENLDRLLGYRLLALVFNKLNQTDSAVWYAKKAVNGGVQRSLYAAVLDASKLLIDFYRKNNLVDSALKYQDIMLAAKDTLFSQDKVKLMLNLTFDEQQRQLQLEAERTRAQEEYKTRVKFFSLLAGIAVTLLVILLLYRNNRHKQQTNKILEGQKDEIILQRDNLDQALKELKETQGQLVQREKMASLGELTSGIAHEIQNPLNFVNNFSEVNKELLIELKEEIKKGNINDANAIADDAIENSEKINHHGKRADAIVKGMLEHSRQGTGQKQTTDVNSLADEYLKLAYQSMLAKDKNFNVVMKTDFDNSIGPINIIPQDIGRVLLNLYNNAFYAASLSASGGLSKSESGNIPTVQVSTKKNGNRILITVKDNGPGIPQNIIDKIFQPFFTTKPTGQGTGLGLSLAYDIVKAHGGDLAVKTKEGEGAEFVVVLPAH